MQSSNAAHQWREGRLGQNSAAHPKVHIPETGAAPDPENQAELHIRLVNWQQQRGGNKQHLQQQ